MRTKRCKKSSLPYPIYPRGINLQRQRCPSSPLYLEGWRLITDDNCRPSWVWDDARRIFKKQNKLLPSKTPSPFSVTSLKTHWSLLKMLISWDSPKYIGNIHVNKIPFVVYFCHKSPSQWRTQKGRGKIFFFLPHTVFLPRLWFTWRQRLSSMNAT